MLHYEFNNLIGRVASDEEYNRANGIYMTVDVDKKTFCEEWEDGLKTSKVLQQLDERYDLAYGKKQNCLAIMKEAAESLLYIRYIGKAGEEVENVINSLLDPKEVIRLKLKKGYDLSEADKNYIYENI